MTFSGDSGSDNPQFPDEAVNLTGALAVVAWTPPLDFYAG